MVGQVEQQDAISNNLANCNSPGYKRASVSFAAVSAQAVSSLTRAETNVTEADCVVPTATVTQDTSRGVLEQTGSSSNFAIDGPGYFVVSSGRSQRLTRNGNFTVSGAGVLETPEGEAVLGQKGPIHVSGTDWKVDGDGTVRVNGSPVDRLRVETDGQTRAASQTRPSRVIQGQLEGANVSTVREMVSMITGMRAYEANQKVIQSIDQTLDKIINTGGRTA
jgi:flagellar basal-body rod protein FlgG